MWYGSLRFPPKAHCSVDGFVARALVWSLMALSQALESSPPVLRRSFPRDVSGLLEAPSQDIHPATFNADASLGLSAMVYRPEALAFGHCDAELSAIALLGGNVPRGHEAPETSLPAQRRKVGFRPCCVVATHVAIPRFPTGATSRSQRRMEWRPSRNADSWRRAGTRLPVFASPYSRLRSSRDREASDSGSEVTMVPLYTD